VLLYSKIVTVLTTIFLIHFLVNLTNCLVKKRRLKTEKSHFSVFLFSVIVLLNFRYQSGIEIIDRIYFGTLAVLFLPIKLNPINSLLKYLTFVFAGCFLNVFFYSEILIEMEMIVSFFIILSITKEIITGPARIRLLALSHVMIIFFLSMRILQFSVYQYNFALNKSNLIIYFSIHYLLIVSLFYVFVNTNFRRHFFI
jgi:hypothetical protein